MMADEILRASVSIGGNVPELTRQRVIHQAVTRWLRYRKYGKA